MVSRLLIPAYLVLSACSVQSLHAQILSKIQDQRLSGAMYSSVASQSLRADMQHDNPISAKIAFAWLGIAVGLVAGIPILCWMNRRHHRHLREQRALLGDELHDQLGPMVYYTRMLVANEIRQVEKPSESLLELQSQLAQTGETVRDLSKALRNDGATTLSALEAFLAMQLDRWQKLGSSTYSVHGPIPDVTLTLVQYTQLLRVLQEFMLNSCRHAPGKPIHLAFEANRRNLSIRYWDEGQGLDPSVCAGTGSESTLARMQRIGGSLAVDNRFPSGFEIVLSLPI